MVHFDTCQFGTAIIIRYGSSKLDFARFLYSLLIQTKAGPQKEDVMQIIIILCTNSIIYVNYYS